MTYLLFRLFALVFLTGLLLPPVCHAQPEQLRDIRVGLHHDRTRVVIESNKPFPYRLFALRNPDRLIIDMPRMNWQAKNLPNAGQSPIISQSRYGLFRPDILRLVIDLKTPITLSRHQQYINQAKASILLIEFSPSEIMQADLVERGWREYLEKTAKAAGKNREHGVVEAPLPRYRQKYVVMIDPGHGGIDPGAVAKAPNAHKRQGQVFEKDIVLTVGKALQHALEARDVVALMTRHDDYYIPLGERFHKAEAANADVFVSLHADAAENPRASGASIYTLSDKASDKEAAKLARQENASDIRVGVDALQDYDPAVQLILLSMSQRVTQTLSSQFADSLISRLAMTTKMKNHAHRSAGFMVLKSPVVPSVLVELGYMSNDQDRARLTRKQHQEALAEALAEGIVAFLKQQGTKR